jgi:hypothetical protein
MTFTKKLARSSSLNSQFTQRLTSNELITVFATHQSDYRAVGTARHNPFMPSNKYGNTSCFRIFDLLTSAIWEIAENHVRNDKNQIFGRFDFLAKTVYQQRLDFDPDNTPPRHANIVKWPNDKQAQKSRAQQIAAESIFHCEVTYNSLVAQVSYDKKKKYLCGVVDVEGNKIEFITDTVKKLPQSMGNALNNNNLLAEKS